MGDTALEVGQTVVIVELRRRNVPDVAATVVKVGRKYATLKGDSYGEWVVDKFTGTEKPTNYAPGFRAFTPEDLVAERRRSTKLRRLYEYTHRIGWESKLTEGQIDSLLGVLGGESVGGE